MSLFDLHGSYNMSVRFYYHNIFDPKMIIYLPKELDLDLENITSIDTVVYEIEKYIMLYFSKTHILVYPEIGDFKEEFQNAIEYVSVYAIYKLITGHHNEDIITDINVEYENNCFSMVDPNSMFRIHFTFRDGNKESYDIPENLKGEYDIIGLRVLLNMANFNQSVII